MNIEKSIHALSTDKLFIKHSFYYFLKYSLPSNACTWYANYYSIADIKGGVGILVALKAKSLNHSDHK